MNPSEPEIQGPLELLKRSLRRGRLGHAYLFTGADVAPLEKAACHLAQTLNCESPLESSADGRSLRPCLHCLSCRKIEQGNHPDVAWIRPESKSRIITIGQMRELMQTVNLKPTQALWKVSIVVEADRLKQEAANAFLKTLEEPPAQSIMILLSTDAERLLDTILSRCLRLNFGGESAALQDASFLEWLKNFAQTAADSSRSLLGRYRLLSQILNRLTCQKDEITKNLQESSPLERHEDADPKLKERWQTELNAAIEAEYRRCRMDLLTGLQWWFRDIWLDTLQVDGALKAYPHLSALNGSLARRITPEDALANLQHLEQTQRLLNTNVQEALTLEVGLLNLKF